METKFAEIADELWEQVEPLLPTPARGLWRGRPAIPNRTILSGIVYRFADRLAVEGVAGVSDE